MNNYPTGTVTFLFTDIEGSTKLAQEHPDQWDALRKRHDDIMQCAIDEHNGYVFKTIGDAFCAAFHTAGDALHAAITAQMNLHAEAWGNLIIKSRMGVHTGKADILANGDYNGYATLSRLQRLMSAGHGGQTLISQATQELIRDELPQGITLRDMGERRLKDLIHPEHIYQVNIPSLPTEFPALKTLDSKLNNLPAQMTPFVGREREIAAVLGLMRNLDVRLVTLTGAGGAGKTRLSLQVAADLLDEYEHGVWFVELASISNPELVLSTIASTLKVKESAGTSIELSLHEYLSKRQLLLVIDNFEQVVSAAPVIGKLLAAAPKVKVLTSSREILHLRGEHDYPVPPLGLPEAKRKQTAAVLAQYEAIALFIQHARAANPSFELDEGNASIVAEICTRLDGLPLAIELGAARSRLLKPSAMLEKLKNRLGTLTGGARDLPQRQQTIRGAIDWSYELLDEAEKILFARLGVFVGGWTVESADAICNDGLSLDVLNGMESLLDKSLLRQFYGVSGETRFAMLETIREYAFEKLTQSGELLNIQQSHTNYMSSFLDQVIAATSGPEEVMWFGKLDDELDNLRSVVKWALAHDQSLFVLKTGRPYSYWSQRGNFCEPFDWLERAMVLHTNASPLERAWAFNNAGNLLYDVGETQRSREYHELALALFREVGDNDGIARCLNYLGNVAYDEKDFEKARQFYEQSLASKDDDSFTRSTTLNNLGNLARFRGDWQASKDYYMRSLEICKRLGAEAGISYANLNLGTLAMFQRDLDKAQEHIESLMKASWVRVNPLLHSYLNSCLSYIYLLMGNEKDVRRTFDEAVISAIEYFNQSSKLIDFWFLFDGKARLELINEQTTRAVQLFGMAWTRREKEGFPLTEFERPDYEARIAEIRSIIGDAAFDKAFAKGQAMNLEQAIAYALEETND